MKSLIDSVKQILEINHKCREKTNYLRFLHGDSERVLRGTRLSKSLQLYWLFSPWLSSGTRALTKLIIQPQIFLARAILYISNFVKWIENISEPTSYDFRYGLNIA